MESVNLRGNISGLRPIVGAQGAGLNQARSEANQGQAQPSSPAAAQSPQEALTYIDLLYKSGRTAELAAILRRSQVFREAWLILQRSFASPSEAAAEVEVVACPIETTGYRFPSRSPVTSPKSGDGLAPGFRFTRSPAQALEVYQSQLEYYERERRPGWRMSARV